MHQYTCRQDNTLKVKFNMTNKFHSSFLNTYLPKKTFSGQLPRQLHAYFHTPMTLSIKKDAEQIFFGMGCFWGAERLFWKTPGVISTSVGYSGGNSTHPSYKHVCQGNSGHTEVVQIVFDPKKISLTKLLGLFWENHDPTQGMRQGNDIGSQYRSVIFTSNLEQGNMAIASKNLYQETLEQQGIKNTITTEIKTLDAYFFAEEYHQQYLHKNPDGYCGLNGLGICMPTQ